jgi:serralysin
MPRAARASRFGSAADVGVFGGSGKDNIVGMAGRDAVDAGPGVIAWNDPAGDVVFGGEGAVRILDVADEIHGTAGNDIIPGSRGS